MTAEPVTHGKLNLKDNGNEVWFMTYTTGDTRGYTILHWEDDKLVYITETSSVAGTSYRLNYTFEVDGEYEEGMSFVYTNTGYGSQPGQTITTTSVYTIYKYKPASTT